MTERTPWNRLREEARARLRVLWRAWQAAHANAQSCPESECACGLVAEEAAAAYVAAAMAAHAVAEEEGE
jgi:hypothetical protein